MIKLAPARVSHWDDFFFPYRLYMMTGSFHILLFNGTFHVEKITRLVQNHKHYACATRSSLPADRFHTEMGICFTVT